VAVFLLLLLLLFSLSLSMYSCICIAASHALTPSTPLCCRACRARMVSDESTATSLRACSTADALHDVSQVDAGGDDAGSCRKPEFSAWLNRWYSQPLFAGVSKSQGFNDMLERRLVPPRSAKRSPTQILAIFPRFLHECIFR